MTRSSLRADRQWSWTPSHVQSSPRRYGTSVEGPESDPPSATSPRGGPGRGVWSNSPDSSFRHYRRTRRILFLTTRLVPHSPDGRGERGVGGSDGSGRGLRRRAGGSGEGLTTETTVSASSPRPVRPGRPLSLQSRSVVSRGGRRRPTGGVTGRGPTMDTKRREHLSELKREVSYRPSSRPPLTRGGWGSQGSRGGTRSTRRGSLGLPGTGTQRPVVVPVPYPTLVVMTSPDIDGSSDSSSLGVDRPLGTPSSPTRTQSTSVGLSGPEGP